MTIFEYKFTVSYKNTDVIQTVKTGSVFPLLFICIFEGKTDEKCHCQMNSKINYRSTCIILNIHSSDNQSHYNGLTS